MDKIKSLIDFGLSETEAKIYLFLLGNGEVSVVKISKGIGLHRRTIYDNLEMMLKKGFVSFMIENGTKYFSANNPKVFKTVLEEKNFVLNRILPELTQDYKSRKEDFRVQILKGKQSAKLLIDDVANAKDELLWLGGGLIFIDYFKHSNAFVKNRLSRLKIRMIQPYSENLKSKIKEIKNVSFKVLPEKYSSIVGFAVYADKIVLGSIENEELNMVFIENKAFSNAFRNYFELIWNVAVKPQR